MDITLIPGDYLIDNNGHHVLDCKGYATICDATTTVTVTKPEDHERIWNIIQQERVLRGLNPDGTMKTDL